MFALSYTFRRSLSGVRYGSVELGEKKEQKWSLPVIPIFFYFRFATHNDASGRDCSDRCFVLI